MIIDLLKTNCNTKKYKAFLNNNMLSVTVNDATRITNTTRTLLDHILVNNTDFYCIGGIVDPGLRDHQMVYITCKRLKPKSDTSYFIGRSYRNFDENLFWLDVNRINWLPLYTISDTDITAGYFTNVLLNIIDTHAPFKK